jgi:hypothetical protein
MTIPLAISFWVVIASVALVLLIERGAQRAAGAPLPWWRRLMIPLPIMLFLCANIDGILSLRAYLDMHPNTLPFRYSENQAWNTDRLFNVGIAAAALLPFLITSKLSKLPLLVLGVWFAHVLWIFFALAPLLLATGVPFRD